MFDKLLEEYAKLTVRVGVNVQKDQLVVVRATTETKDFVRKIVEEAYKAGAKKVYVDWSDDYVNKSMFTHAKIETLEEVEDFFVEKQRYYIENNACFISISSSMPGLNAGLDGKKISANMKATQEKIPFFQAHLMANKTQWVVVGYPNQLWAEKVFPNLKKDEAQSALLKAILNSSRVFEGKDAVSEWEKHNEILSKHNKVLNDFNFKSLHFKNSLGTDLVVELVDDHIWAGGSEISGTNIVFNPNIPTEESFTMPYKYGTKGRVYATKPLNYQGKLIEDFYLDFDNGKVVGFDALKEKDALKELINTDEGSSYIGEIALISHDSPISNTNILFYNTLYDENASCHMALGKAYAMNIKNGTKMSLEELMKHGANHSVVHSDFMFGSEDMKIIGLTKDLKEVVVFENGNFVI